VFLGSAELAAVCGILGRLPTLEEYREYTKGINPMDRDIYRYLNFNELDSYTAAAEKAPKPNQLRVLQ
jgi:aconitate hydratase 2/2-methylisocitrate dehydratase